MKEKRLTPTESWTIDDIMARVDHWNYEQLRGLGEAAYNRAGEKRREQDESAFRGLPKNQ